MIGMFDLVGGKKKKGIEGEITAIDVIAHEEKIVIGGGTSNVGSKYQFEIFVLAVNVSTNYNGGLKKNNVAFGKKKRFKKSEKTKQIT
jgi:hypothetical protein